MRNEIKDVAGRSKNWFYKLVEFMNHKDRLKFYCALWFFFCWTFENFIVFRDTLRCCQQHDSIPDKHPETLSFIRLDQRLRFTPKSIYNQNNFLSNFLPISLIKTRDHVTQNNLQLPAETTNEPFRLYHRHSISSYLSSLIWSSSAINFFVFFSFLRNLHQASERERQKK